MRENPVLPLVCHQSFFLFSLTFPSKAFISGLLLSPNLNFSHSLTFIFILKSYAYFMYSADYLLMDGNCNSNLLILNSRKR
jgi:hypothetical protein